MALAFLTVFTPIAVFGQRIRIADLNMSRIGEGGVPYPVLAATVDRFDVVAADGVSDAGGMEKVLAGMDDGWEATLSREGFYGFFYSERVPLVRELGTYPGPSQFGRPPYGAQFRLAGSRFAFNLVVCHIDAEKGPKAGAAEIAHIVQVYRYYEKLTGNRGITILAGSFGEEAYPALPAVARGEVIALEADSSGTDHLHDRREHMFASTALRPLIEEAGIGTSTPHPAYVVLRTGK